MQEGGTELGFMSTTTDLSVAVKYSLSATSLIFKIVPSNFMSAGADISWLSAFPQESEILYPPLTFIEPTGRTETISIGDYNIFVVEVIPTLA